MTPVAITLVGLGPGSVDDLTLEARRIFGEAAEQDKVVYFRTLLHPTIEPLMQAIPGLRVESFDQLYEESDDWSSLYQNIAETICTHAGEHAVIYAVPGHPLVGEISVQLILRLARERNLTTRIVSGLSFIEPVCNLLELDPFDDGLQILDATELASLSPAEVAGRLLPTKPLLIVQVYNRRLASAVKLILGECYADEWSISLVRAASVHSDEAVLKMPLYELDRNTFANHLSTLYVPPVDALSALRLPETLRAITVRLRRDPDGCPWDRQQTHKTLKKYMLEEAYEVVEAIDENDYEHLAEELGDVLLQVYLHSEVARQQGNFSLGDVFEHISAKMIRRHPHVFGDTEVQNAGQVVQNWEAIKRQERAANGGDVQQESVLDRVPLASPALVIAQEYQKRIAKVGFEYASLPQVYAKLHEELEELQHATDPSNEFEEMGDVLYMAAHLAHFLKIDAEDALRQANRKLRRRFQHMEQRARAEQRELSALENADWEEFWLDAKAQTKED